MELNELQKAEVAKWFSAGASLDEIQKRIKAEFGVHLTYLDVRLLVAELPQPEEAEESESENAAESAVAAEDPPVSDQEYDDGAGTGTPMVDEQPQDGEESQAVPAPTVAIDAITIPGTIASGDVTFSDGKAGKWYLDQMGRLGLGNLPEGYRPSPTDAALFQQQLMSLLQSKGLY